MLTMKRTRYTYHRKPRKCPVCGSKKIARIMYGLIAPTEKLLQQKKAGEIVFGGCIISDDDPEWKCVSCGQEFYKFSNERNNLELF